MDNIINAYEKEMLLALKRGNVFYFEAILLLLIVFLIFFKMNIKNIYKNNN